MTKLDVDGVFCISTRDSEERRVFIQRQAEELGLAVEFVIVDRDFESGERGCFFSHKKCASLALARGYEKVLILEDDVLLLEGVRKKASKINKFLSSKQPEIFYLGATLGKIWLTWDFNIARIRAKGTYSYILSRKGCEKLSNLKWEGKAIDKYFSKIFIGYTIFPFVVEHQVESILPSKIAGTRGHCYTEADAVANRAKQYSSVFSNLHKTIFRVGF